MRTAKSILAAVVLLTLGSVETESGAQEWVRFRGPNGAGVGLAKNLPVTFAPADINWKAELPGEGHSSPVLWGGRIFLTSAEGGKGRRSLLCLDAANGKILWSRDFAFKPYHTHEFNNAASATPAVDAERVYTLWPAPEGFAVTAHTLAGKQVWRRDLGAYPTQHGGAGSPVVHGGLLLFGAEPEEGEGALYALDCKTGETRWKRPRPSAAAPYATPLVYKPANGPEQIIFSSTAHGLTALNLKTGEPVWEVGGLFRARCVGSVVQVGDLIFATAGNGGGDRQAVAVRPALPGGRATVVYKVARGTSYVPTPLAHDGRLYFWGDGGVVTCVKAATGEAVWSERVGGNFFGSPIYADGKLYALSTKGELVAIATGDRFQLLGKTDLGEPSHATPAVAGGVLYLRTGSHLISVGGKKPQTASAKRKP